MIQGSWKQKYGLAGSPRPSNDLEGGDSGLIGGCRDLMAFSLLTDLLFLDADEDKFMAKFEALE
jgi:hypothetical protein